MKLRQARRLELRILRKNGLMEKLLELIHARQKLFLKFKKSTLHIDEENQKKVKYQVQNLLRKKKREFYETNLRQKMNKPKGLWKTLKSMALPSKAVIASNICLKDKNEMVFNATKNCFILKNYFASLAHNTVSKDLSFQLSETSPEKILSI